MLERVNISVFVKNQDGSLTLIDSYPHGSVPHGQFLPEEDYSFVVNAPGYELELAFPTLAMAKEVRRVMLLTYDLGKRCQQRLIRQALGV